jgi:hypothetical protein
MADDRMRNDDDRQRNMVGAKDQDDRQEAPGRSGQQDKQAGGQQQKSNYGSGQNERDLEDDDLGAGKAQTGGQNRGGQNR